jgi:hypothetical protein
MLFDDETNIYFWIMNVGMGACPARIGLFVNLTNLQATPAMIYDLTVEAMDKSGRWVPLPQVHVTGDMQLYLSHFGLDASHAGQVDAEILDRLIEGRVLQPRLPTRGWMFFDNPFTEPISNVRIKVYDTLGIGYTSTPLMPARGNVQDISFRTLGHIIDLRKIKKSSHCGD